MSELAFNLSGEPFEIPAAATGWRVRRMKQRGEKGAPEVVYGRDGVPLVISIEADMSDLRRAVDAPGRMRLDLVNEGHKVIDGAPAAYVQVMSIIEEAAAPVPAAVPPRSQSQSESGMVEAMRMNTELAKAVIEKFPAMMESAAVLIQAADGAGIASRPPFLFSNSDDEGDSDDGNDEPAEPSRSGGIDINALVAQVVPVVVMGLMNGKLDLSKLGELLDWRKAAASGRAARTTSDAPVGKSPASRASDAPRSKPVTDETSQVRSARAARSAGDAADDPLPPLDPAAFAHFLAVRAALTPEESEVAKEVAKDLSPAELRRWIEELKALSVADAVARIRTLIGAGDAGEEREAGS